MLIAIRLAGCQQEDIIYPEPDARVAETYLTLNKLTQSPLQVPGPEGTYILKVISDDKWTLSSSQVWCSVSETERFKHSQVPILCSENPWNEPRTAELTFLINESQEIEIVTVEQEASETSSAADSKELQYSIGGGGKSITLQTNTVKWNIEIVDELTRTPVRWCTVTPAIGKGTATSKVTTESNTTEAVRKASLIFTAVDKSLGTPVIQTDKLEALIITLDDHNDFLLSWNEITGVDGYKLEVIADQNENTIDIPSGTASCNLDVVDRKGHIGTVSIQLFSYADIDGGTAARTESKIIEIHNLSDEASEDGEEGSEYIITKPRHLRNAGKYPDKSYKQTVDIDPTGIDTAPISTELINNTCNDNFTGVYEVTKGGIIGTGTGRSSEQYKTKNWTPNKSSNTNCGLFAFTGAEGIVRNVHIENVVIKAKTKVGAITGSCSGKTISCHTTGNGGSISTATTTDAEICLGRIVGYLTEKGGVSYCSNTAAIEGTAGCVSGIAGIIMRDANNVPVVAYCIDKANVVCDSRSSVGGMVDLIAGAAGNDLIKIIGHANSEEISGTQANNQVEGTIGRAIIDTEISWSYNIGSIIVMGSASGIIARTSETSAVVRDCYNTDAIKSIGTATNGNNNVARIVATCTIAAGGGMTIGGCHNIGDMTTANGASFGGGLFYHADGKISQVTMRSCLSLNEGGKSQSSGSDSYILGGSSSYKNLSASEMKNTFSFTNWNFSTVWEMGGECPTLQGLLK